MPEKPLATFVISLADSAARRAAIGAALGDLGLPFAFVDAVDGRRGLAAGHASRIDRDAAAHALGRQMSDAEFACALSHLSVYDRMIAENLSHALVFEDDALPTARLKTFVELEGYRAAPLVLLHHLNARILRDGDVVLAPDIVLRPLAVPCFRAAAYTLSQDAARWLRDANTPVTAPADWPGDITRLGALVADPEIVGHPPATPGQSTLSPGRGTRGGARLHRFLEPGYARRVWRKAHSRRIS